MERVPRDIMQEIIGRDKRGNFCRWGYAMNEKCIYGQYFINNYSWIQSYSKKRIVKVGNRRFKRRQWVKYYNMPAFYQWQLGQMARVNKHWRDVMYKNWRCDKCKYFHVLPCKYT
jgi:hypothetical protein